MAQLNYGLVKQLPKEIMHIILEYYGQIYYKNGTYINKIHKYDLRYKLLEHIPKMAFHLHHNTVTYAFTLSIRFTNKKYVLIIDRKEYGKYLWYDFLRKSEPNNNTDLKIVSFKMELI